MHTRYNHNWPRRGFALLWDTKILGELIDPADVISTRELFALQDRWPDQLPAAKGHALIVAGLEGSLDVLSPGDAEQWMTEDFRRLILSFQGHYEGQAGLIFWMPSGLKRLSMNHATEAYFWKHRESGETGLPLGRLFFSGAECEVDRLLDTDDPAVDVDGPHWIGLHHLRIS